MKFDPHLPRGRWWRLNSIYCIANVDDAGKLWLPLNRDYKPLGISRDADWVDYEAYAAEYPTLAMRFARDPRSFKDIWIHQEQNPIPIEERVMLWLYSDRDHEADVYYARLRKLFEHKIN